MIGHIEEPPPVGAPSEHSQIAPLGLVKQPILAAPVLQAIENIERQVLRGAKHSAPKLGKKAKSDKKGKRGKGSQVPSKNLASPHKDQASLHPSSSKDLATVPSEPSSSQDRAAVPAEPPVTENQEQKDPETEEEEQVQVD